VYGIDFSRTRPESVREPVVAGLFYPDDPGALRDQVNAYLEAASVPEDIGRVIAIVSPHAGYPYSGQVAAHGFKLLARQKPRRVVVIAPCHVDVFQGASIFSGSHYSTPLGKIPVDREFAERIASAGAGMVSERGHVTGRGGRGEHALEVQLPFLQTILENFTLVPIVLGSQDWATCRKLGLALADVLDSESAIIASSDLSHYHPYAEARDLDRRVVGMVGNWDYFSLIQNVEGGEAEACGAGPVAATMIAAQLAGGNRAEILNYSSSGDVAPFRRDGVVGYLSAAFVEGDEQPAPHSGPDPAACRQLLKVCRQALVDAVRGTRSAVEESDLPGLLKPAAVFVTLRAGGALRGCIGSIVAREPLVEAVSNAATNAATLDPRFPPVTESELDEIDFEISVLSPLRILKCIDEIEIGRDGLVIEQGTRRGLLLPQVAPEHGWDRRTFLRHTCTKAGLDPTAWERSDTVIFRFSASVFGPEIDD